MIGGDDPRSLHRSLQQIRTSLAPWNLSEHACLGHLRGRSKRRLPGECVHDSTRGL